MKGKKLRGKRKRKEERKGDAKGSDFQVDVADERFAAVLEGDSRFGIDRTDVAYKHTEGMQTILKEQKRRKKLKKKKKKEKKKPSANEDSPSQQTMKGKNDSELKYLVSKLKSK